MASGSPEEQQRRAPFGVGTVAATATVWLSLAALVFFLRRVSARSLLESPHPVTMQAIVGVASGAAMAGGQLVLLRIWDRWRAFTREAVRELRLTPLQILAIAAMVAVAEELFFRAAIQPLAGLWITSALFALGHMRLDRGSWTREHAPFGLVALALLLGISAVLGVVYAQVGLASAITSHFVYDAVVLWAYRRLGERSDPECGRPEPEHR